MDAFFRLGWRDNGAGNRAGFDSEAEEQTVATVVGMETRSSRPCIRSDGSTGVYGDRFKAYYGTSGGLSRDIVEGRWVIETRFRSERWEVIVEPIPEKKTSFNGHRLRRLGLR